MWHSVVAPCGCMAEHGFPEPHQLTPEGIARHKGIGVKRLLQAREAGSRRIEGCMAVYNLLEWYRFQYRGDKPWQDRVRSGEVHTRVNEWCNHHWIFHIQELNWDTQCVAVLVYPQTIKGFAAHCGHGTDWGEVLEASPRQMKELYNIFNQQEQR